MHCVVWYSARTIARGKTRPNEFSAQSRHASEYLVRQVSLGRKAPATKHYVSPLELRRSSSLHEYSRLNSKRVNIRVFLFFLSSLLASFYYWSTCGPLVGPGPYSWVHSWVHSSGELVGEDVGALVGDDVRELVWNVYTSLQNAVL
jgi:hypothetical protein